MRTVGARGGAAWRIMARLSIYAALMGMAFVPGWTRVAGADPAIYNQNAPGMLFAPGLNTAAPAVPEQPQAPDDPEGPDSPDVPAEPDEPDDPDSPRDFLNVWEDFSPQARMAALEDIRAVLNATVPPHSGSVEDRDLYDELVRMADALLALPHVTTTIVDVETLTLNAILRDGLSVAIVNNRPPGIHELEPPDVQPAAQAAAFPGSVDAPAAVPGTTRAVVTNFDGGDAVRVEIADLVRGAGFEVLTLDASVESMRNYRNLGLLYLDTHGIAFYEVTGFKVNDDGVEEPITGNKRYGLQTSSDVSEAALLVGQTRADLAAGRLIISYVEDGNGWRAKLGITERFISRYWSFDNGIVLLHACFGGAQPFSPTAQCRGNCFAGQGDVLNPFDVRLAIILAGAHALISFDDFTNATWARPGMLFLLNRALGLNTTHPLSPPARPFSIQEAERAMSAARLHVFRVPKFMTDSMGGILPQYPLGGNNVRFTFTFSDDPNANLAPSIHYVEIVDDAQQESGELTLHGVFGERQGVVQLAGFDLAVQSWSHDKIVAAAPFHLTGDLVVKTPGQVKSNAVPITMWSGQIFYTQTGVGSLKAELALTVRFRADVHRSRALLADVTPKARKTQTYFAPGSTGRSIATGSYTSEDFTVAWSGNRGLTLLDKTSVDAYASIGFPASVGLANAVRVEPAHAALVGEHHYGGIVTLDPKARRARVCWIGFGDYQQIIEGESYPFPFSTLGASVFPIWDGQEGFLSCIDMNMGSDYALAGGSRSFGEAGGEFGEIRFEIRWTRFEPQNAPNAETPG